MSDKKDIESKVENQSSSEASISKRLSESDVHKKNKMNDFMKQRISSALKPMKMFINFNPEEENNFE